MKDKEYEIQRRYEKEDMKYKDFFANKQERIYNNKKKEVDHRYKNILKNF